MNVEVEVYFPDCERVQIDEGKNFGDIESYVTEEVKSQKRRLLDGKRPDLEERLIRVLTMRAQGMFIWVKLQLAVFLDPKTRFRLSKDVERKLDALENDSTLPETNALYEQIMEINTRPGTYDREYAMRALQWVLSAIEDLSVDEVAKAISIDCDGNFNEEIDGDMVLDLCSNLVTLDNYRCCRLAHLSVRGFLLRSEHYGDQETRSPGAQIHARLHPKGADSQKGLFTDSQIHAQMAERCLSFIVKTNIAICEFADKTFSSYAIRNWAYHCGGARAYRNLGPLCLLFSPFMDASAISQAFTRWQIVMWKEILPTETPTFRFENSSKTDYDPVNISNVVGSNMMSVVTSEPFPAFVAASFGFPEILRATPAMSVRSKRGKRGESCLHFAAWAGQTEAIEVLVDVEGMDLGLKDIDGSTALHIASMLEYEDIVIILLDHITKEDIFLQDNEGETALHLASYYGNEGITERLIARMDKATLALQDSDGRTALHLAVRGRCQKVTESLLNSMRPEDLALQDYKGETALLWCAEVGEPLLLETLLSKSAPAHMIRQDKHGNTALHLAARDSEERCVELLLEKVNLENLAIQNVMGETPLHMTMRKSRYGEGGARGLLAKEIYRCKESVAAQLLAKARSEDLWLQDHDGRTALHLACKGEMLSLAQMILTRMIPEQISLQDRRGQTALHASVEYAAQQYVGSTTECQTIVSLLLKYYIELETVDHLGETPLLTAVRRRNATATITLLERGARINAVDNEGWSALHFACEDPDTSLLSLLIERGADVNAVNKIGITALHCAVDSGTPNDSVEKLLRGGADPNLALPGGETALHCAVYNGQITLTTTLLAGGANPMRLDGYGRTPMDWALQNPHFAELRFPNNCVPTDPTTTKRILGESIIRTIHKLLSEQDNSKSFSALSRLGRCLLLSRNLEEASTSYQQAITNRPWKTEPIHPAGCDMCATGTKRRIKGARFVCQTCADTDLCSPCMGRYDKGSRLGRCQGHKYLCVPGKFLPNGEVNKAGEMREQWLNRMLSLYGEG
ncbi:hypothetical protein MMC28_003858 [Mycoblastus sanguinarius]|nr:hypothetical protein [Mycoblastus sanguinarius]